MVEYEKIKADTFQLIGNWFSAATVDTYNINGKQMIINSQGTRFAFHQTSLGRYFFYQ
jgi:hypothetical protein